MPEYLYARTAVYNVNYHFVWCVKYRRKVLTGAIEKRLKSLLKKIAADKGFVIKSMQVMPDNIHVFASAHPKLAPSYLYKMLKGITARRLLMEFPDLRRFLLKNIPSCMSFFPSSALCQSPNT
ncbi:MAG: IS200/IS605 family transposase [Desulfobacteraceae bacterium]|nr:IS200/IS605 family transposase [Desulfobacteraceae bacterium]